MEWADLTGLPIYYVTRETSHTREEAWAVYIDTHDILGFTNQGDTFHRPKKYHWGEFLRVIGLTYTDA